MNKKLLCVIVTLFAAIAMSCRAIADTWVDTFTDSETGITWEFTVVNQEGFVTGVIIPEGITEIPEYFCCYSSITNVTIPSTVMIIGKGAFEGCDQLKKVTFNCSSAVKIMDWSNGYESSAFGGVGEGCVACVKKSSHGWDDDGDGLWNGLILEYTNINGGLCVEEVDGVQWTYCVFNDCYAAVGSGRWDGERAVPASTTGRIKVPSMLGGCQVVRINDNAFSGCGGLTEVELPCGIKHIGNWAFHSCSIGSITLPDGLETIGEGAFDLCTNLRSLSIPDTVTEIGGDVFSWCTSLWNVDLPSGLKNIGDLLFYASGVYTVDIPEGVTNIGVQAFHNSSICELVIPSNVVSIGSWAFCECKNLRRLVIPGSVINIGNDAFVDCNSSATLMFEGRPPTGIDKANIPKSVTILYPQEYKDDWKSVIDFCQFDCAIAYPLTTEWSDTELPDGYYYEVVGNVTWGFSIAHHLATVTYVQCSESEDVVVPEELGGCPVAFIEYMGCAYFKSVKFPTTLKRVGEYAFANCTMLKQVVLNEGLGMVGAWAFEYSYGIEYVYVPSTVRRIDTGAFSSCNDSTFFDFAGTPPRALSDAGIPSSAAIRYKQEYASQWLPAISECGFTNASSAIVYRGVECANGTTWTYTIANGEAVVGVGEEVAVPTTTAGDIVVPDRLGGCPVVQVQSYAFSGCSAITSVIFPATLTSIQKRAFNNCTGLRSVEFPASLQYLDNSVFRYAQNVTNVIFLGNAPVVDKPEEDTFKSPSPFFTVTVKCGTLGWDDDRNGCWKGRRLRIEDGGPYTEEVDGVAWTFTVKNGGAFVGVGGYAAVPTSIAGDVVVPSYLGYTPVVQIQSYAFSGCSSVTNIVFPSTLTNVQKRAFNGCYALRSVDFPAALQYLDNSVFRYLENVTNVTFLGNAPIVDDSTFKSPSPYFTVTATYGTSGWDDDGDGRWKYREIHYAADFMSSQYSAALDVGGIVFDAVDSRQWAIDATVSHYKGSSIRTAGIGRDGKTFIQTRIVGPKRISFWWAVSSEKDYDVLSFLVDGVEMTSISGVGMPWQNYEMLVGEGMHVIQWKYSKDDEDSDGEDCGWIDCLNIMEPLPEVVENGTSLEYIPEQLETSLVLPNDWLIARGLAKEGDAVSDILAKMSAAGKNGIPRYQSYVLGMEPDSDVPAEEQLKVTIDGFDKDGVPIIGYEPTPNDATHVTVKKLGVKTLGGDWEEVSIGKEADYNFFKVTVEVR